MTTVHIIPFDDERCVQSSKRLRLITTGSSSTSNSSIGSVLPKVYAGPPSPTMFGPIRGTGTTLYEDSLFALEDVMSLTHTIGSSIVLHEAFQVNNRVVDYQLRHAESHSSPSSGSCNQHHQQQQQGDSRRKRLLDEEGDHDNNNYDEMATELNDPTEEECSIGSDITKSNIVVQEKKEEVTDHPRRHHQQQQHETQDDIERRSILRQACRMKRLTTLFRTLNRVQTMIVHEINNCMIENALDEEQQQQEAKASSANAASWN
jgi:hypothetical protein